MSTSAPASVMAPNNRRAALPAGGRRRPSLPRTAASSPQAPSHERVVGMIAQRLPAVAGDGDDLLGPVAGGAVIPDHRLEHEDHPGCEHDRLVELVAEVGADQRHLGALGADTVGEVEVRQPRHDAVVGFDGDPGEIPARGAGLALLEHGVHDVRHRRNWACCRGEGFGRFDTIQVRPKSEA